MVSDVCFCFVSSNSGVVAPWGAGEAARESKMMESESVCGLSPILGVDEDSGHESWYITTARFPEGVKAFLEALRCKCCSVQHFECSPL